MQKVITQCSQELPMPVLGQTSNDPRDATGRSKGKKPKTNNGSLRQPRLAKIRIGRSDYLVKPFDGFVNLRADPTNQKIPASGHLAEENDRTDFPLAVRLWNCCQPNITEAHIPD